MVNSANKIDFFTTPIQQADEAVFSAMQDELHRQQNQIELIASENIVSKAVLQAQGSVLTNKYAEGYPGRRYYGGCEHVDTVEVLAIERACALFGAKYANVQPHSGSQANQGVFLALLKPGDTFMGMDLSAGGHLTHGAKPNLSGKWFHCVTYGVHPDTHLIDYDKIHATALEHKPKLIIAGGSAYPRFIDFKRFREIADEVGAFLLVNLAHFAGLVAGGEFPSPLEHAHVVTSTTHKVLRGPRGGLILSNDDTLFKKLNSAIFPGLQGGPLMHVIAAKAVSFGECLSPAYTAYAQAVVENAKSLTQTLINCGFDLVSGGTDCHLCLVDLRPYAVTGEQAENSLERAGLTCNKNGIPFDPLPPSQTSGIRLGTPAGTTRGFGEVEFQQVGHLIADVLAGLRDKGPENNHGAESKARKTVQTLCKQFPIYTD